MDSLKQDVIRGGEGLLEMLWMGKCCDNPLWGASLRNHCPDIRHLVSMNLPIVSFVYLFISYNDHGHVFTVTVKSIKRLLEGIYFPYLPWT